MAVTSGHTGISIDQLGQHQHQDQSRSRYSLQSELLSTRFHPQSQCQSNKRSSPAHSHEHGSRHTSAQLVSPTSDVSEMATTLNKGCQVPLQKKEINSSQSYGYALNGRRHCHGYGLPSNPSTSTTSSSYFRTDFGGDGNADDIYPVNNNFNSTLLNLNDNLHPISDLNFENRELLSCDLTDRPAD